MNYNILTTSDRYVYLLSDMRDVTTCFQWQTSNAALSFDSLQHLKKVKDCMYIHIYCEGRYIGTI